MDLALPDAQQSTSYTITVSNGAVTATSLLAYVRVQPVAPVLTQQPQDAAVSAAYASGATVFFATAAHGTESFTYQWLFNGSPIPGATVAHLAVPASTTTSGSYAVVVRNSVGQTTSQTGHLLFDPSSRIVNLASRGLAGSGENALIVGFVVSGAAPKQFLIRAAGPALTKFGVAGALADPQLVLYDASGNIVAQNDDWGTAFPAGSVLFDTVGAFSFAPGSKDSAVSVSLPPGAYSAVVSHPGGATGVALAEIYDADSTASRLVNLSSRLFVGAGEQIAIPGIVVSGTQPKKLLIRGIGPTLATFGVQNPLANPTLSLIGPGNVTVASNDDWSASSNAAEIATTSASIGAFALPASSKDAAVLVTLPPGAYTALVSGANGTTGIALVEVYEVP